MTIPATSPKTTLRINPAGTIIAITKISIAEIIKPTVRFVPKIGNLRANDSTDFKINGVIKIALAATINSLDCRNSVNLPKSTLGFFNIWGTNVLKIFRNFSYIIQI